MFACEWRCPTHIVLCFCSVFLRLVYPMLPVSLDCSCLIAPSSCVSYVASFSGLSMFDCPFVLCILCCQFLWIVHVWLPLRLVYPMLPVSLDCPCLIAPSSCVPYVASFSGLSIFDCPFVLCTLCYQFLYIVHFWLSLRCSLTFISCKEAAIERSMESNHSIHIKVEQWRAFVCPFELSGL